MEPGEEVVAELSANSGKMKVRITYEAHLTGDALVHYRPSYESLYTCQIPMSIIAGASDSVRITQDIEIGYHSEVHVTIKNHAGKTLRIQRL